MEDLLERVGTLFGAEKEEEVSTAETFELLCQIALALLIIFVMANTIFRGRAQAQIDESRGRQGVLEDENRRFRQADPNIASYERAMMDVQKQKLLLALEKIENTLRDDFGIDHFAPKDRSTHESKYLMNDLLSGEKVINERFKQACIIAKQVFLDRKKLRQNWCDRIPLVEPGLVFDSTPEKQSIITNPEVISPENEILVFQEIANRIEGIYADCCDMQRMALSYLQEYYYEHTELLKGTEFDKNLNNDVSSASDKEKRRLMLQRSQELYMYIKSLFEKQNVPLLSGV